MGFKESAKRFIPRPVFYVLRDVYATTKDIWNGAMIRGEYTNFSFLQNLLTSFLIFLKPRKTILCYPERPSKYHVFYKLCAVFGYKISMNPNKKCDVIFWSHASTFPDQEVIQPFLNQGQKVINSECLNLSKELVGQIFEETFGYSLDINPAAYEGTIVEKSVYNGTNFAVAIEGPIPPNNVKDGFVYQKKIESYANSENLTLVYRVPVYLGIIPIVYLKYRPEDVQFTGDYSNVEVREPTDVFSAPELEKIILMNKKMGIDYGECDVLRDRDGKIYVVDVNSHPGGPPRKMSHQQKVQTTHMVEVAFKNVIESFS